MEKNKKKIITILMLIFLVIIIIIFAAYCSKQNDIDVYSTEKGVNQPILAKGMKAVKWDGNDWIEVSDPNQDNSWYDYQKSGNPDSNEWANAKTEDGSMWVWIPRYAYKINNKKVDIIFIKNNDQPKDKDYTVHSSFTDKVKNGGWDKEIPGFWVSKFEAGKENNNLVFKPNVYSYNDITIGDAYTLCKNLDYKESDPHMIKASEWGAVAYLAISPYGRNGVEISSNNTSVLFDGDNKTSVTAGGNGIDALATSPRDALTLNAKQSTTGNVYGVYDMAGGLWERVSAYINNGNENLLINGKSLLEDGSSSESNKYKTVYSYNKNDDTNLSNYNLNKEFKGDAIFETSSGVGEKAWFGDYSSFMFDSAVFLHRGGSTNNASGVGIFAFSNTPGQAAYVLGFRCTIVIE